MQTGEKSIRNSKKALWTGSVISMLCLLFLTFDGITKVIQEKHVVQAMAQGGYSPGVTVPLGLVLLVCVALYAFPRTSVLGAVLLTGWLGGATDSMVHMNASSPLFLFPVIFGVLVWLGIYLREGRLRLLIPIRT